MSDIYNWLLEHSSFVRMVDKEQLMCLGIAVMNVLLFFVLSSKRANRLARQYTDDTPVFFAGRPPKGIFGKIIALFMPNEETGKVLRPARIILFLFASDLATLLIYSQLIPWSYRWLDTGSHLAVVLAEALLWAIPGALVMLGTFLISRHIAYTADWIALFFTLTLAVGKLRCAGAGCCAGLGELHFWTYTTGRAGHVVEVSRIQVLDAAWVFAAFLAGCLFLLYSKKYKPGHVAPVICCGVGLIRFLEEYIREPVLKGYPYEWLNIYSVQWCVLVFVVLSALWFFVVRPRAALWHRQIVHTLMAVEETTKTFFAPVKKSTPAKKQGKKKKRKKK
ncbi:MAG: hypothetical protein LBN05_07890 [Oscillospiraceae bacterium]|jgi:hypothetical protein|nr:hypothetical protein [Oscillospiraceae bacterium]